MGSSINVYLELGELDCMDPEHYIAKAVALATTPSALAAVKSKLDCARQTNSFFATRHFVRRLEEALQIAWDRHVAGLPPADIRV